MTILGTPRLPAPHACLPLGPPGAVLFSKWHHPRVLACVRKTKIKSPWCDIYLHPWRLDMAPGVPGAPRGSASLWASSLGVEHGTSIRGPLETPPPQKKALRATTLNTTEGVVSPRHAERAWQQKTRSASSVCWNSTVSQRLGDQPSGSPCAFVYRLRRNRS